MSNSPLVEYTRISPNQSGKRNHAIDTITIHCVVGQCYIESLGALFANPSMQASSNYGIGFDGKVGMFVEEKDRSWCTSSAENDNRAITIECASDTYDPFAVNDVVYAKLLDLVTDICKRNGIKKLIWSWNEADRVHHLNGCNMTVHRDYAWKSCPGEYLYQRHQAIADEVNRRLNAQPDPKPDPKPEPSTDFKPGDIVKLVEGAKYTNGRAIPEVIIAEEWIIKDINGSKALIDKSTDGKWSINSWVYTKYLEKVSDPEFHPYIVRTTATILNVRQGPGTNYNIVGQIVGAGAFTIVEEQQGQGSENGWGLLKAYSKDRNGWIALDWTTRI